MAPPCAPGMEPIFYYRGERIRLGDAVRTGNRKTARVVPLTAPGQVCEWTGKVSPSGNIGVEEDWDGSPNPILFEPYGAEWEDLDPVG